MKILHLLVEDAFQEPVAQYRDTQHKVDELKKTYRTMTDHLNNLAQRAYRLRRANGAVFHTSHTAHKRPHQPGQPVNEYIDCVGSMFGGDRPQPGVITIPTNAPDIGWFRQYGKKSVHLQKRIVTLHGQLSRAKRQLTKETVAQLQQSRSSSAVQIPAHQVPINVDIVRVSSITGKSIVAKTIPNPYFYTNAISRYAGPASQYHWTGALANKYAEITRVLNTAGMNTLDTVYAHTSRGTSANGKDLTNIIATSKTGLVVWVASDTTPNGDIYVNGLRYSLRSLQRVFS